jgi:hypothetical protein
MTTTEAKVLTNTQNTFSDCLEHVMRQKDIFDTATHQYLLNVMREYVDWRAHETLTEERETGRR